MKKALIITSVASMVDQFLLPSIRLLQEMKYDVHVLCNFEKGSTCSQEKVVELKKKLDEWNVPYCQVDFARDITKVSEHLGAYKQIKKYISEHKFELVHCHSPIGGVLTRLACRNLRKKGLKVYYTAHGFHFYQGAPLKNWLLYYPVEKCLARYTDVLITINHEDYERAQKKLHAKKVVYIPGVGVDLDKFGKSRIDRAEKRRELGIPENAKVLLSVGEVNNNKNHQVIIRALSLVKNESIHYLIAGRGEQIEPLKQLTESLGLSKRVHFLGFRNDIPELCVASDVFCFPSKREGLGLASLEAMSFGLPLLTSNVHGINDYSHHGVTGYKYSSCDAAGFAEGIRNLISEPDVSIQMGEHNQNAVKKYSIQNVLPIMKDLYNI